MTVAAEKITRDKAVDKGQSAVAEKAHEKRRALGRGLESLLPGPRVIPAPATIRDIPGRTFG